MEADLVVADPGATTGIGVDAGPAAAGPAAAAGAGPGAPAAGSVRPNRGHRNSVPANANTAYRAPAITSIAQWLAV